MKQAISHIALLIVGLASFAYSELRPVPSFLQQCHKSDPKLMDCIVKSIETLRPHLAKGIPEIDMPPIDPLDMGNFQLSNKRENQIDIICSNMKAFNVGEFKIVKATNKNIVEQINAELLLPSLDIDGNYKIDGVILALPLKGAGRVQGTFKNVQAKVKLYIEPRNEFLTIKAVKIKAKFGKGKIKLHNLFGDNKALGEAMNESINQNIESIANELLPAVEKVLEKKFAEISNIIFDKFTADQLLLE